MPLAVGIVGPPKAGKTTLFNALTGVGATVSGKENVGMAPVVDYRLARVAEVVGAKKVTPASIRVVDVPGSGAQLLGNLRQVDALLLVLDGWSGTRSPEDDRVALGLELILADREHVQRRLERVSKEAKSGDPALREEAALLERLAAHLDAGETLAGFQEPIPTELEPLTTKPLLEVVNGPEGIDLQLESELAELPEEDASAFRESGTALDEVVGRLFAALDLHQLLHRRREGDAGLDAAPGPDSTRGRRGRPLGHRSRLHPRRGDPLGRPRCRRLPRRSGAPRPSATRGQALRRRGRRRAERQVFASRGGD